MKILYLVDSLDFGGVQSLVKCHLENQQNNKDIYVYSLRNCKLNIEINHHNVIINKSVSRFSLSPIFNIKSFIKKNRIDILHCYLFRSLVFAWVIKLLFYRKIKLIYHEQGTIFGSETDSKLFYFIYRHFIFIAKHKIDKIIAISAATRKRLISIAKIDEKKIIDIYNCIDLKVYDSNKKTDSIISENRTKLGFTSNDFVVSFAGRLIKRKGWEIFLQAAFMLKNKPRFKFLIAGNGVDKDLVLNFIAKNNLADSVVYYGYCSDMVNFYLMSDCFVVPSHWEPQGLVELEAQALKIPVIAADVEALNEIITDNYNGLLFDITKTEDLTNKIESMESDVQLREKLIKNGIENAKKYSIDYYIKQLDNLYHGLF